MPSVTDIQQQEQQSSSITYGKSTPPPTQQITSTDTTNNDPLAQAILVLEKKQRNLGKRKEKLEGYQEEAKKGKELNKDQQDALAKYPDVLGQIECVKELHEQFKKIQTESSKNQKRLLKQAAEEKRLLVSQSLRQYAQLQYLLEHRPTSIKPEESSLLDELSAVILPADNSVNSISRSVDTVLSIYQNGPASTIKSLTGKNPQEIREILEELIRNCDAQQITPPPPPPPSTSEQEPIKELEQTNDIQSSNSNFNDYPMQFDTRNQNIPLEQIIQDNTFFSLDLNNQIQENNEDQSLDANQFLPTMTVVNSNIIDQPSSSIDNQQQDEQQQQQPDGQWQYRRGNGNTNRGGQFNNGNGNRNYNRRGSNNYHQQQRGGPRGGRYDYSYGGGQYDNSYGGGQYDNSYGDGQRQYNEYNRGRGGYRGHRGGGYRGGYNNNNNYANGYQKSAQHEQVHSAPPSQQQ